MAHGLTVHSGRNGKQAALTGQIVASFILLKLIRNLKRRTLAIGWDQNLHKHLQIGLLLCNNRYGILYIVTSLNYKRNNWLFPHERSLLLLISHCHLLTSVWLCELSPICIMFSACCVFTMVSLTSSYSCGVTSSLLILIDFISFLL